MAAISSQRRFAEALEAILAKQKWSQRGIVERAALSQATISRIISGNCVPDVRHLQILLSAVSTHGAPQEDVEELRELCFTALADVAWSAIQSGHTRQLRPLFDSHRARRKFRSRIAHAERGELRVAASAAHRTLAARHFRRRIDTPHCWKVANEILSMLREPAIAAQIDLDLVRDFAQVAEGAGDAHRLIFPSTATLAYRGDNKPSESLLSQIRKVGAEHLGLVDNVVLYYGSAAEARARLSAMCDTPPPGLAPSYLDAMVATYRTLIMSHKSSESTT